MKASTPCHWWPPSKTSWTSRSPSTPRDCVDRPQPPASVGRHRGREEVVVQPALHQHGPGGDESAEIDVLHLPEHPGQDLGPTHVPGHLVRLGPRREVTAHHAGGHPLVPGGQEQGHGAAVGESDHADPARVHQGMVLEDVEAPGHVPQVLGERVLPGHHGVDQVGVTAVVVGRVPVGPLAETAEVGGEDHVPPPDELDGVVAVGGLGLVQTAHERLPRSVAVGGQHGGAGPDPVVGDEKIGRHRHRRLGVEDDRVPPVTRGSRRCRASRRPGGPVAEGGRAGPSTGPGTGPATPAGRGHPGPAWGRPAPAPGAGSSTSTRARSSGTRPRRGPVPTPQLVTRGFQLWMTCQQVPCVIF